MKITKTRIPKIILLTTAAILLLCFAAACSSKADRLEGTYTEAVVSGRKAAFTFTPETENAGTAVQSYESNGKIEEASASWTLSENEFIDGQLLEIDFAWEEGEINRCFAIYLGDTIVFLEDTDGYEIPDDEFDLYIHTIKSENISSDAPQGETFNWKWKRYEFFDSGSYVYYDYDGEKIERTGSYFIINNIIYLTNENGVHEEELYVCDGKFVARIGDVFVRTKE